MKNYIIALALTLVSLVFLALFCLFSKDKDATIVILLCCQLNAQIVTAAILANKFNTKKL